MKIIQKYKMTIVAGIIAIAGIVFLNSELHKKESVQSEVTAKETITVEELEACIYVQVTGAIKHPGVYTLPLGARLFQLIEAAGGFLEDAYTEKLNLVSILEDGQKIMVYTVEEWNQKREAMEDAGMVNINTASIEELMTLPGIGEARAKAIIEYRDKQGEFSSIEDIMNVTGIKTSAYEKIKEKIYVQ